MATVPTPQGAPAMIKVGHLHFTVRFFDAAELLEVGRMGYFSDVLMEIGVYGGAHPVELWSSFWHEVAHSLVYLTGSSEKFDEEGVCSLTGQMGTMVMADNPFLHEWQGRLLYDRRLHEIWKPDPSLNGERFR